MPAAARYQLMSWTSAGGYQQLDDGALVATNFTHAGLTAATTYYYWVRAVSVSGETGEWSERASATVGAAPPITVPTPSAGRHRNADTDSDTDSDTDTDCDCDGPCAI